MKKSLNILADESMKNKKYGCKINGELHIAPELYIRICNEAEIDEDLLGGLTIVDVDEMVYIDNLDDLVIFSGQQVKVLDRGAYVGDATVTSYPHHEHFGEANISFHFPNKGKEIVCPVTFLVPITQE